MTRCVGLFILGLVLAVPSAALAKGAKDNKEKAAATDSSPNKMNACGCYKDSAGTCFCKKGAKCGCPEECEPKGCEEKRAREIEREIAAETKKAQEADKKARQGSGSATSGSATKKAKPADNGAP